MSDYAILRDRLRKDKGSFYSWLINEFIPDHGENEMVLFIQMKFNPHAYYMYKAREAGAMKPHLREEFEKIMTAEYKVDFKEAP